MRVRALSRVACWKMAEGGGRWLTWLLGTDCCTTTLQPAAGGIFRGQRGAESGESGEGDIYMTAVWRSDPRKMAEDGGRWLTWLLRIATQRAHV